ncbi:MAG TPA: hypothetical protein VMT64_12835 [Candidatus Binataceae bacterium]|nr:hypothetical protein [Candidatus Binataceae bacterium]
MKTLHNVDIAELSREQAEQIRAMTAAIGALSNSRVWTATMRPSVRGGKPCGFQKAEADESMLWTSQMRPSVRGGKELVGPFIEDRNDQ